MHAGRAVLLATAAALTALAAAAAAHPAHGATFGCRPDQRQYGQCMNLVEKTTASCVAEWFPNKNATVLYLRVPDTPNYPNNPSGVDPFAGASGSAFFFADGRFRVACAGDTDYHGGPWKDSGFPCNLFRGGADFNLKGSRWYSGSARVIVSAPFVNTAGRPTVHVRMSCTGTFQGIYPGVNG
jgi:hypothetical protein